MPRSRRSPASPVVLERELDGLRKDLAAMGRQLAAQGERLRNVSKALDSERRRQDVLSNALRLGDRSRKGDRGVIRDLQESIVRLEEYLIKTSDRIENILTALKHHRELLLSMNKRVLDVGTKDRIRLELDVMKNTLSILALNGIEVDAALGQDIERLRKKVPEATDLPELERAKAELDRKFDGELKKFDLESLWSKRKEIAGYG